MDGLTTRLRHLTCQPFVCLPFCFCGRLHYRAAPSLPCRPPAPQALLAGGQATASARSTIPGEDFGMFGVPLRDFLWLDPGEGSGWGPPEPPEVPQRPCGFPASRHQSLKWPTMPNRNISEWAKTPKHASNAFGCASFFFGLVVFKVHAVAYLSLSEVSDDSADSEHTRRGVVVKSATVSWFGLFPMEIQNYGLLIFFKIVDPHL